MWRNNSKFCYIYIYIYITEFFFFLDIEIPFTLGEKKSVKPLNIKFWVVSTHAVKFDITWIRMGQVMRLGYQFFF